MQSPIDERFDRAIAAMDAANARDPKTASLHDREGPRELIFAQCVYDWVQRLAPGPSKSLLLAARGHTLERWHVPREGYPMDRTGYHAWRDACARHHATAATRILREHGYLTRDDRKVERKKYGQAGARRRFQFSKR